MIKSTSPKPSVLSAYFSVVLLSLLAGNLSAQTTLSAGDIAIVGFHADNPDDFAFLLLKNIEQGTEIIFTDNGWETGSSPGLRSNEETRLWTASTSYDAGSIITASSPEISGSLLLSVGGDQIFAYQGSSSTPSFLYGIHFDGNIWDSTATSSNTSGLPTVLDSTGANVALGPSSTGDVDNGIFDFANHSPSEQTPSGWLAAINDSSNWITNNTRSNIDFDTFPTISSGSGTIDGVSVVPSPAAGAGVLALMAVTAFSRHRRDEEQE